MSEVSYRTGHEVAIDAVGIERDIDRVLPGELRGAGGIVARFAVEPYMTCLAVINATARDLETMGVILSELEACGGDKDRFTRWDSESHFLLAHPAAGARLPPDRRARRLRVGP